MQHVIAGMAIKVVIPVAARKDIVTPSAVQHIIAHAAMQGVIAVAAMQIIVSGTADDQVVGVAGENHHGLIAGVDDVVESNNGAVDHVGLVISGR